MATYPKSKFRGVAPGEQGDLRDPGGFTGSTDRWPYISVTVQSAAEEATLDPTYTWYDNPTSITGADASILASEPSWP